MATHQTDPTTTTTITSTSSPSTPIGEEADAHAGEMPMTMAASVMLEHLPRDASSALRGAGELAQEKVTIYFRALPGIAQISPPRRKVKTAQRFEEVVRFIRRNLRVPNEQSVFCYVNSVFAPGLDEQVGNLWRCFKTGDELHVNYGYAQAFG